LAFTANSTRNRWNCKTLYMMWISFPNAKTTNFIWSEVYRFEGKQELKILEAHSILTRVARSDSVILETHKEDRK
jgi:hypothetical protein